MARRRTAWTAVGAVALLLGGYGVADAADIVPGVLTTGPAPADPATFPAVTLPGGAPAAPAVAGPDAEAPVPGTAALETRARSLTEDPRMAGAAGIVVADAVTGATLLDADGATARVPASSQKLLTAAAALDALGAARTLTTSAVQAGKDSVVLVGGGDVMLAAGAGDPGAVMGRAGLGDLAAETAAALRAQGLTSVGVGLDDRLFTGPLYASDVTGTDRSFVMPVQALAVETGQGGGGAAEDPALDAARTFAAALAAQGVTVRGDVGRAAAPADAAALAEVRSAPVGEQVRYALKHSDNSVTEVLARLVAVERGDTADFAGATAAVLAQLDELGVDVSGVHLEDGSGLSMTNRVPPAVLADVLLTALDPEATSLHGLPPSLPVGGLDGTLDGRFSGGSAGIVRAKTGTLNQAISLSGTVVDADGRLLVFAVLTDSLPLGTALDARAAVDDWVDGLAACGCA
ncbi:D-alanyl-D-alanine carboxypeptidase/D-alanyl-D-alanine-endopeptidase [Georgenia sp. SYP-B2076]|uniref:D-alanyl-D-alanine carboxypeptidase/D-alanyl-D-alanine endopeptidase n=1 Tax=Georgenia sp. SYP-B2076 TaxID=2495881 RepID=UPI000F8DB55E|nr:D-alanyl-D-alanine carboxypeptidase/D-alanyl-D-alanine-endopeptidase [Georgenia sp. SYP-B2076]